MIEVRGHVGVDDGAGGTGACTGDRPPLPEVFAELAPRLRRMAARRVGENLADDVVQETFLRAHRAYDRYVDDGRSWAWVRNIAEHVCIDLVRRSRVEAAAVERVTSYRGASPADETFASVEAHEERAAMAAVLAQLQPRQRRVLLLRDFDGWSTNEVAVALGMTIEGVKATLKRARGSFRAAYAGVADGRYVAGVLGAVAALRRALRRTTAAPPGATTVGLVSALVVITTLTLTFPVVPFVPDIDAVRDGVAQSTSSPGARLPHGHGRALAGPMRSPARHGAHAAAAPDHSRDGVGGADAAVAAPAAPRGVVPVSVDDDPVPAVTDTPRGGRHEPPSLEVETDLSPTCDLMGSVNLGGACASLGENVTVDVPPDGESDSAPHTLLPLNLTSRSSMAVPTSAAIVIVLDRPETDGDTDAGDTSEPSTAEERPAVEEAVDELPLVR